MANKKTCYVLCTKCGSISCPVIICDFGKGYKVMPCDKCGNDGVELSMEYRKGFEKRPLSVKYLNRFVDLVRSNSSHDSECIGTET